jgi:hypothetical protein
LLRIHQGGLLRADPEEVRVELGGIRQETALVRVGPIELAGLGVIEVVWPAAVGRQRRQHIRALGHDPPQVVGRSDPTGIPAAHRDDHDRIVVLGRSRDSRLRDRIARGIEQTVQVGRDRVDRGIVEGQGRREPEPGSHVELVTQFDRGQRIEAQLVERPSRIDGRTGVVAEHRRDM